MANKNNENVNENISKTWVVTVGMVFNDEMRQNIAEEKIIEVLNELYEYDSDIRLTNVLKIRKGIVKIEANEDY